LEQEKFNQKQNSEKTKKKPKKSTQKKYFFLANLKNPKLSYIPPKKQTRHPKLN